MSLMARSMEYSILVYSDHTRTTIAGIPQIPDDDTTVRIHSQCELAETQQK
jgi:hypothetical protein